MLKNKKDQVVSKEVVNNNNIKLKGEMTMLNSKIVEMEVVNEVLEEASEVKGKLESIYNKFDEAGLLISKSKLESLSNVRYGAERDIVFKELDRKYKLALLMIEDRINIEDVSVVEFLKENSDADMISMFESRRSRVTVTDVNKAIKEYLYSDNYKYVNILLSLNEDGSHNTVYTINTNYKNKLYNPVEEKFIDELDVKPATVLELGDFSVIDKFAHNLINLNVGEGIEPAEFVYYNPEEGMSLTKQEGRGWRKYRSFSYSASEEKKRGLTYLEVNNYDVIANTMSDGAHEQTLLDDEDFSIAALSKKVVRQKQGDPVMTNAGVIEDYAIYLGTLDDMDGVSFIDSTFLAEHLSDLLKLDISSELIRGNQFQMRPGTTKVSTVASNRLFINYLLSKTDIVEYKDGSIYDYLDNNKGKFLVIGDATKVKFVCDMNGVKANTNPSKYDWKVNIMDFRTGHNDVFTSKQMLNKLSDEVIAGMSYKGYGDLLRRMINSTKERESLSSQDLDFLGGVLKSALSEVASTNNKVKDQIIEDNRKNINKALNKMRFQINGDFKTIAPDLGAIEGIEFINKDEVYTNDTRMIETEEVFLMRYPAEGTLEYRIYSVIGFDTIKERILESDISNRAKQVFISEYKEIKDGTLYVSAKDEFKDLHGGADFDFDSVLVAFMDKKLKDSTHVHITHIVEDDEYNEVAGINEDVNAPELDLMTINAKEIAPQTFKYNDHSFYVEKFDSSVMSVGMFTNNFARISAIEKADLKTRIEIFELVYGDHGTQEGYKGLFYTASKLKDKSFKIDTYVSKTAITNVVKELSSINFHKLTAIDWKKIFVDLDSIGRYYQERIIDSSKTGEVVIPETKYYRLGEVVQLDHQLEREIIINQRREACVVTHNRDEKRILLETTIGRLQAQMLEAGAQQLNNSLTHKAQSEFSYPKVNSINNYMKELYTQSTTEFVNRVKQLSKENSNLSIPMWERTKDLFSTKVGILGSMIRYANQDKTNEEIAKSLLELSCHQDFPSIISNGAYTMVEEEVILYYLARDKKDKIVYDEAKAGDVAGDQVVVDGIRYDVTMASNKLYRVTSLSRAMEDRIAYLTDKFKDKVLFRAVEATSNRGLRINKEALNDAIKNNLVVTVKDNILYLGDMPLARTVSYVNTSLFDGDYTIEVVENAANGDVFLHLIRTDVEDIEVIDTVDTEEVVEDLEFTFTQDSSVSLVEEDEVEEEVYTMEDIYNATAKEPIVSIDNLEFSLELPTLEDIEEETMSDERFEAMVESQEIIEDNQDKDFFIDELDFNNILNEVIEEEEAVEKFRKSL